jgi:hypothetical protein
MRAGTVILAELNDLIFEEYVPGQRTARMAARVSEG